LKPIDDDEFNIPPVDFEPSLESILNDVEDGSVSDEEVHALGFQDPVQPNLLLDQLVRLFII
jgi:hypothetical protein